MKRILVIVSAILVFAFCGQHAQSDIIILDMDPSTAPIAGLPAGPSTGFESTIGVTPGSTVTVIAYLVPETSILFDSFGMDMNFGAPGDTAVATPDPGTSLAGSTASLGAGGTGSLDLFSGGTVIGGTPLSSPIIPLPAVAPFTGNLGGVGYYDPSPLGRFSGLGALPTLGVPIDIFGQDFTITGSVGDSVSIMPSGIFVPGVSPPLTPPTARLLGAGTDALYDSFSGATISTTFIGGSVVLVPEPGCQTILMLAGTLALGFGRFRRVRTVV